MLVLSTIKFAVRRPYTANIAKDLLRNSVGAAYSLGRPKPKRFLIVTNGRTGSNLLVSLLNAHPKVLTHSEIFGEYQLEDLANRQRINRIGPTRYLQNAFRPLRRERAVGLKCLYHHFDERYGNVRGVPALCEAMGLLGQDDGLQFIHLKRNDLLGRLVSTYLANQSRNWEGGAYKDEPVDIDLDWAKTELDRMVASEQAFDTLLPDDRTLTTSYEALVADPQQVMDDVWSRLALERKEVHVKTRKQNTRPHTETLRNYAALKASLSSSQHEALFAV